MDTIEEYILGGIYIGGFLGLFLWLPLVIVLGSSLRFAKDVLSDRH